MATIIKTELRQELDKFVVPEQNEYWAQTPVGIIISIRRHPTQETFDGLEAVELLLRTQFDTFKIFMNPTYDKMEGYIVDIILEAQEMS